MNQNPKCKEEILDIFSDKLKETMVFCDNKTNFMRGGKMDKIDRAKVLGMISGALDEVLAQGRKEAISECIEEINYEMLDVDCRDQAISILSAKVEGE